MNKNEMSLIKKLAKINVTRGLFIFAGAATLMGCGRNVSTEPVDPTPTQTIETTIDDPEVTPEVDIPVVEPTTDPTTTPVEEDKPEFEDATFIQTGEHEYTINIDCPDNSEAPELAVIPSLDLQGIISGTSGVNGISENLILAVLTHGAQVSPNNITQINIENYGDCVITENAIVGERSLVITDNPSAYGDNVFCTTIDEMTCGSTSELNANAISRSMFILRESITATNGNITCGLTRFNMGPKNWDIVMKECMDATGLTEEQIYANYDSSYVLSYDTMGLGDPNYANDVLQYVNGDIVITEFGKNGGAVSTTTYTVDRVKTYGTL
nr:hypothetical protein [Bacilli bacterium]